VKQRQQWRQQDVIRVHCVKNTPVGVELDNGRTLFFDGLKGDDLPACKVFAVTKFPMLTVNGKFASQYEHDRVKEKVIG